MSVYRCSEALDFYGIGKNDLVSKVDTTTGYVYSPSTALETTFALGF